ncbi:hypothetical protein JCM8547_008889 [Rhodosporidiobolus lusitaniae]
MSASPPSAPLPSAPAPTTAAAGPPLFRPLSRTASAVTTRSEWERQNATAPAAHEAHDLPERSAFARLERTGSARSVGRGGGYAGGAGLSSGPSRSRRGPVVVDREGRIEEHAEGGEGEEVREEEVAVGEGDEVVLETKDREEEMYDRFSPRKKSVLVAIVSFAALLAPFASSSFLPSIPQICEDLDTTPSIINITVAIYILVIGIAPLAWAPYAGVYGRRPIYVISLPIFVLGSMGVALSNSLAALIVTRVIQAVGSCSVLSVGAGTIGDLYKRTERGSAMGLFYLGILVGPATAPAIAGILTGYAHPKGQGWRAMQWLLCGMGVVASLLCFFCFPETAHARGVDVIREERLARRAEEQGVEMEELRVKEDGMRKEMGWLRRWYCDLVWTWLNPISPVRLLLHPNILAMSITSSFVLMSTYTILVPLSQTIAPRYGIDNAALLGCFYLAQGLGNVTAARFTGKSADWVLKRWLKKRNGVYVPEDRLRATLFGLAIFLPGTVLSLGWVIERVGGKVGLAWAIILLFLSGASLMSVLAPLNTHLVDLFPLRASEAIAINNACRYIIAAAASAFVLPMINAVGVGWTNTMAALFIWAGFLIVLATIRYGPQMRRLGAKWEGTVAAGTEVKEQETVSSGKGGEEKGGG